MLVADFVAELALSLAKQNARAEALALVEESIAVQVKANRPLHLPALFVAQGSVLASGDATDIRAAEACFDQAMTLARQQSALSFELRAGLEMARMWIAQGEHQRVGDLIGPIYSRFSEGFAIPDLISAKRMLEQTDVGMTIKGTVNGWLVARCAKNVQGSFEGCALAISATHV